MKEITCCDITSTRYLEYSKKKLKAFFFRTKTKQKDVHFYLPKLL